MEQFQTKSLPAEFDVTAPDGSGIRILVRTERGSMAHGTLAPGSTSRAIRHKTVDEIWFVLSGMAEHWRMNDLSQETFVLRAGDALTIPVGASFQFRTIGTDPFTFVMCTMPPWPDDDEAEYVTGMWQLPEGE